MHECNAKENPNEKHFDHTRLKDWVFCIHTLLIANLGLEFLDELDLKLAHILA